MVNRIRLFLYGKRQLICDYPIKLTGNSWRIKGCAFFTHAVKLWNSCQKILSDRTSPFMIITKVREY